MENPKGERQQTALFRRQKRYYAYYDGPPEGIGILFLFTADEFEREMASAPQEKGMMADLRKLYRASDDETMNESLKGF